MSDERAARLAAIRAANAARRAESGAEGGTTPSGASPRPIPPTGGAAPAAPPARPAVADDDELPPAMAPQVVLGMLLAAVAGAFAAVVVLPAWLPGLSASLLGAEPKAYWYLARSSAFVAYGLLWLSMLFGLLMTNKFARIWPGGPTAYDIHQHTSLLGLAFSLFHALILLGDRYVQASPLQVLVPFAYAGFAPFWVGLGQLALYGLAVVGLSFYVKGRIGRRAWRGIHFLSFAVFGLALAHGVWSGSDSAAPWATGLYWATGAALLFLTSYRVLAALAAPAGKATAAPRRPEAEPRPPAR